MPGPQAKGDPMRPPWCTHADCDYALSTQEVLCVGKLPVPVPHDGVMNDGRICFSPSGDDEVCDFQIHRGDAWNIRRLLGFLYPLLGS